MFSQVLAIIDFFLRGKGGGEKKEKRKIKKTPPLGILLYRNDIEMWQVFWNFFCNWKQKTLKIITLFNFF
jgi:hypothetical protein